MWLLEVQLVNRAAFRPMPDCRTGRRRYREGEHGREGEPLPPTPEPRQRGTCSSIGRSTEEPERNSPLPGQWIGAQRECSEECEPDRQESSSVDYNCFFERATARRTRSENSREFEVAASREVPRMSGAVPEVAETKSGAARLTADEHVFLIGRPPISEFLGFIKRLAVDRDSRDLGPLTEEWRTANDRVRELEDQEAGWADDPAVDPLPEPMGALKTRVLQDPIFQETFRFVPTDIGMVELDRLVVFQKHINLRYVEELKRRLGTNPTAEKVFKFCLPFDHPHPPVRPMQTAPNAYSFISPSEDFRFIEGRLFSADQIAGYRPRGPVAGVVGLVVGYGSNFLNVIRVENRLILNNGSHRAFALRDHGITRVPAIIQHVSRRDELELIGSGDVQQNPDRYLKDPRPPVLKDYFDPALRKIVPVSRKNRMVRVSFAVEQSDIPAG